MSLQGSWSDDGKAGRRNSTSADYLHRQDTTGSTNSPEAPLTRQQHLWPETTPVRGPSAKPAAGPSLSVQQPRLALQVRSLLPMSLITVSFKVQYFHGGGAVA